MPTNIRFMSLVPAGAAAMLAAVAANAQTAGAPSQSNPVDQLQVIVVTATKRPENVQNVPMTVDTLSSQQIEDYHLYSFQDIQSLVPGLQLTETDPFTQTMTLRGIPFNPDSGFDPAVDIYWNETSISADTAFRTMFDMGQVEVLSGPQGTLRGGESSPAGAILLETRKPDMYDYGGYATESFSNQDLRHTEGALNLPFIPGVLALRVAAVTHRDEESGIKDIVTGQRDHVSDDSYRATLEWKPSDWFDSTLVYQELHSNEIYHLVTVGDPDGVASPGTWGAVYGQTLLPSERVSIDPGSDVFGEDQHLATLTEHVDIGDNLLTSITGYSKTNDNVNRDTGNQNNAVLNWPDTDLIDGFTRQVTQELRFQSTGQHFWDYLFGAYYGNSTIENDESSLVDYPGAYGLVSGPIAVGPPNPAYVAQTSVTGPFITKDVALFTDHRFHITSRDQIELGVRWLDETVHRGVNVGLTSALMDVSSQVPGFPMNFGPGGAGICAAIHGAYNSSNGFCDIVAPIPAEHLTIFPVANSRYEPWTGSASYKHHFTDDVMAYLSYGHSYRPPSPSAATTFLAVQPQLLDGAPETSNDVELGLKTTYFDRRLQVNGDIYYQKFNNFINQGGFYASDDPATGYPIGANGQQTCDSPASCAATTTPGLGNSYQYIAFVGNAYIKGAELSISGIILKGWTAALNMSYADARYDGPTACNSYNGSGTPDVNLATSVIPGAPAVQPGKNISICESDLHLGDANPFQMTLTSAYEAAITSRLDGYVRALYQPVLAETTSGVVATTAGLRTPFYQMVDLYLGLRASERGNWDISIWAKNLLNETAAQTGYQLTTYIPQGGIGGQAGWPLVSGYGNVTVLPPREVGMTVSYEFGQQ